MWEFELDNDKLKLVVEVLYADKAGDADFALYLGLPSGEKIKLDVMDETHKILELRKRILEEIFKNLPEGNYERD